MPDLRDGAGPAVIRELPEVVRNQIAAGEVVERPASVVKELVENALDAGATRLRIDLEEGGVALVRVVDDGGGMGPRDLALAFQPHATSKLYALDDLDHIASLGFRGEALASIGAVSRARILTRPAESLGGHTVSDEGGRLSPVEPAAAPVGTTVEVRDLFFNTPARRRFLKRTPTELGRCLDILQRLALAHVGVGFVVTHDGRRVLDVEPAMDLRARVRRLFGAELADALVGVEVQDGPTRLAGLVAPPRFSRRDTARQMWFLNGRALRDKLLVRVLKEGYRGFLVEGRQPCAFLHLSMDPSAVDVNVHPTKSEVRFREERRLFGFLVAGLREAVARTDIATPGEKLLGSAERRGAWIPRPAQFSEGPSAAPSAAPSAGYLPDPGPGPAMRPPAQETAPVSERGWPVSAGETAVGEGAQGPAWRGESGPLGPFLQVARTYILRALPDGFEIVDQHALHERMSYEALRAEARAGKVAVQRLLVPEIVALSRDEVARLEEHIEGLERLGIELTPFGPKEVAVQGLPARLPRVSATALLEDLVALLEEKGRLPEADDLFEELLHRKACRSSIMAGDELSQEDMRALLARAGELESDQTCPHARPTRVRFTLADLEKAFHRR